MSDRQQGITDRDSPARPAVARAGARLAPHASGPAPRGAALRGSVVIARALARLDGDDLVLTMRDGAVHSRIPVDDTMDPAEALERLSEGTMPVRLLWTVDRTSDSTTLRAS